MVETSPPHPPKRQKTSHDNWSIRSHGSRKRPSTLYDKYTIAWICALYIEMATARAMLDETHDELPGQANDSNTYTLGSVKEHNVVIACLPTAQYGTNNAANVLTHLIRTFPSVRLALMVGIGGGVPNKADVRLGDVVVGTRVIQHDLGKLIGDTQVLPTAVPKTLHPSLGTAISNLRSKHELEPCRISSILRERLKGHSEYGRPSSPDRLFQASYAHEFPERGCEECDPSQLIPRSSRMSNDPMIHYGAIASGNQVLRHGITRDDVARRLHVICFEMEAAGLMDVLPCLPIRGICDYSDSHKSKEWQTYAAATAAAYARELLEVLPVTAAHSKACSVLSPHLSHKRQQCSCKMDEHDCMFESGNTAFEKSDECDANHQQRHFMVPFGRNREFVGREAIIVQLLAMILPSADRDNCQRVAIEGLGGVGKTQIALEAVFRLCDEHPDCSVFWIPALDATTFESAYRGIGRQLKIKGIEEDNADVGSLVKTALSESAYSWLLIIDNADDAQLFFGNSNPTPLSKYLPFSRNGSILFTTRNHQVAIGLDTSTKDIFTIGEMSRDESIKMLRQSMKENQVFDDENANGLLDFLADLPLAIKQASSYMAKTGISIARYFAHCRSSDKKLIKLLSKGFEDRSRYETSINPVAATWLISFEHISRENKRAAEYLRFMCLLSEKGIPNALLPPVDEDEEDDAVERDEAIGVLKAYAFVSERSESHFFDVHRLVRLAMRNWLEVEQKLRQCSTAVVQWLAAVIPSPAHENRDIWLKYLPHVQSALDVSDTVDVNEARCGLLFKMGICFDLLGKYQGAEEFHRASLQLRKKVMGTEHPDTLDSMNSLANVLQHQGRYWEAEHTHRQTRELRKEVLGQEHPDTVASMNNLALSLVGRGKYEEAEQLHRRTLELRKAVLGKEHPETLASMNNLALLLDGRESYEEAEQIYQQTVRLMDKVHGREHPNTLVSRNNYANVLQRQGRHCVSEHLHRQTLQLRQKVLGEEHPDTLASMNNLALVLVSMERYDEGEKLHRQTLELRETVLGKEHPDTLASMKNLTFVMQYISRSSSTGRERLGTGARRSYSFQPFEPTTFASGNPGYNSSRYSLRQPDHSQQPSSGTDTSCCQPTTQLLHGYYQRTPPQQYSGHLQTFSPDYIPRSSSTRSLSDLACTSTAAPSAVPSQLASASAQLPTTRPVASRPLAPPSAPQHFGAGAPDGYFFKYSNCTGRRKALLIGINYFGQRGQLRGCLNDVRNMTAYLAEHLGCKRGDMVILTDDQQNPMSQPTKQNILRAMHWLVKGAQPNDSLFFHYSGHGGQTKDLDGDEPDGNDEVIYPADFRRAGHITDDEMHHIMVRPLCAGVRLTAIFDSCHSGTALDLPYIYSTQGILKEPNLAKEAGQALLEVISSYRQGDLGGVGNHLLGLFKKATSGEISHSRALATKTSPADVIMLSGSKDDQTYADVSIASQATGAMSWAFITALKKNPHQSYVQLLNSVRDQLATRYTQNPQLSCSHPLNTNLLFVM